MEQLSPKQTHEVNAVLSADVRLPPPRELAKVPEQHGDDLLEPALEKNAVPEKEKLSLGQKLDASQEEKKSLRQQLDASQKERKSLLEKLDASQNENKALLEKLDASQNENKARGQKLTAARKEKKSLVLKFDASQKENKSLRQELDASQKECKSLEQELSASQNENKERGQKLGAAQDENKSLGQKELDMRQLFNDLKKNENGKELDRDLWDKSCKTFPSHFKDTCIDYSGKAIKTFSGTVIHLATEKKNLLKEKEDLNLSSNRCSKIASIDKRLASLKAVASSLKKPEMNWDASHGKGFYSWCLLVADVNKACHRDMTKQLLDDMDKRAARREYRYEEVELGPAVRAAIFQMRLELLKKNYKNT